MELKGAKINFLGDSITAGHGTSSGDAYFWNRIKNEYGAICRGYGIGGTRIARKTVPSAEPICDEDFVKRVDTMDPDADIIVVLGGTNDFGHGDAKLGTMTDRTEYTFYGALHILCEKLIERYPAAQLVFMTPLHRISESEPVNEIGLKRDTDLASYCRAIKEVAEYYSVPVLDLYSVSGIQPRVEALRERYMPDGLHPNDAGHALMARKLANFIKTL